VFVHVVPLFSFYIGAEALFLVGATKKFPFAAPSSFARLFF